MMGSSGKSSLKEKLPLQKKLLETFRWNIPVIYNTQSIHKIFNEERLNKFSKSPIIKILL